LITQPAIDSRLKRPSPGPKIAQRLDQVERLQRRRQGKFVPPPVNANVAVEQIER